MNTRKFCAQLHKILGLAFAIPLIIVALTAALSKLLNITLGISWGNPVADFLKTGHFRLWMSQPIGGALAGYFMLAFLIILLTGVVMWWPTKALRMRSWKSLRPALFNIHAILGIYLLPFLLFFGLTGCLCGLSWTRKFVDQDTMHMLMSIHAGRFFGIAGPILVIALSFFIVSLPITGFMIWLKKKKA